MTIPQEKEEFVPTFLIIDDDPEIREVYTIEIECEFDHAKIVEANGALEAIAIISSRQDFSMVLCDLNMKNGSGREFIKFLLDLKLDFPVILMSGDHIDHHSDLKVLINNNENYHFLKKPHKSEELIKILHQYVDNGDISKKNLFKRIKIERLRALGNIQIELYIKKKNGEYVQLTKAEDGYVENIEERYSQLEAKEVYTTTSEYIRYLNYADALFIKKLKSKEMSPEKIIELQLSSLEYIHQTLANLGFKESSLAIAQLTIQSTISLLSSNKKFSEILGTLLRTKNFKFKLSLLTSYISICVMQELPWKSRQVQEKLALASLLMDLTLEDHLCVYSSLENSSVATLSKDDIKKIQRHGNEASVIIKELPIASNDLESLITLHHERPMAKGFPLKWADKQFSPMACVLILANEFSYRLLKEPLTENDLWEALKYFERDFCNGNFKKAFDAFKLAMKKRLKTT